MNLEFLRKSDKKIVRTRLYGDQEFTPWELELLHTPILQRLYDLKQLGFADRVFPDAVHSRLNHVIGVAEVAQRMVERVATWLDRNQNAEFEYTDERVGDDRRAWKVHSMKGSDLADHVRKMAPAVRLIGFLHDLTHAAFGHTLEDEVSVFVEKHDAPPRQKRFFDALVGQLMYLWTIELGLREPDPDVLDALARLEGLEQAEAWAEEVAEALGDNRRLLGAHLRHLELALLLLLRIEFLHETDHERVPEAPALLISAVVRKIDPALPAADLVLHRDALFVDIVGNTICADLLDYARRDADNSALRVQFDDRLIRYLCAVSVRDRLSPTSKPCIRLAMQFFTDKMRHDVLSEMSGILKARYLISERVLFHPTKCAAGAMLGTAVQLLGLKALPEWVQVLGDQEFVRMLIGLADRINVELQGNSGSDSGRLARLARECVLNITGSSVPTELEKTAARETVKGARVLLWRLASRRFSKTVYRLRSGNQHTGRDNDETVARKYKDPQNRYQLEREVERACCLPTGSLVIHCPTRKMTMKVAQALVVGSDLKRVAHLRDVSQVSPESLEPYQDEIQAVERMYRSIWQFHAFLDPAQFSKRALVAEVLHNKLGFPNDDLLSPHANADSESAYDLLAGQCKDEFAWNSLPLIVKRLDTEGETRMRHGTGETVLDRTRRIIREVTQPSASKSSGSRPVRSAKPEGATGEREREKSRSMIEEPGSSDDKQLPMPGVRKPE